MQNPDLEGILANDHRVLSRVISRIESEEDISDDFFIGLHAHTNHALRLGITGPPGAGKSTLVDQLTRVFLSNGKSVGIVAVDPTSPFTGGALLGDRVRMNLHTWNKDVFIRSMGSHGDMGGLARKAQDVGDALAASGKDVVIFETVGVGQGELDVAKAVDITLVILVPESGDGIQLMKAGLIEIADIFVINKSDREGAGRLAQLLRNTLHTVSRNDIPEPVVLNTVASKGEGVVELYQSLNDLLNEMESGEVLKYKRLERYRNRVLTLVQERLLDEFWTSQRLTELEEAARSMESIQVSPYEIARDLLRSVQYE